MKKYSLSLIAGLVVFLCVPALAADMRDRQDSQFNNLADPTFAFDVGVPSGANLIQHPGCGQTWSSGTITAGSPPAPPNGATWNATQRIFRNGTPSTCSLKTYPGNLPGGPWFYDAFYFDAHTADRCFTAVTNGGTCGSGYNVHPSAWCDIIPTGFVVPATNPPAPNAYLGDSGSSPAAGGIVTWAFCVPANTTFTVLHTDNYTPNSAGACNYSFTLTCVEQSCPAMTGCGGGAPPTGGGGSCNLAPIETKLDELPVEDIEDALADIIDAVAAAEAKLDAGVGGTCDPCEIYKLLHPRLPGKPDAAGSACLGL
jgi:hypothetical protein